MSSMPERSRSKQPLPPAAASAAGVVGIDRLIHEPSRLAIVCALATHADLTFSELKAIVDTSDGNLSLHARKLEDAHYVSCVKTFEGRTPHTRYSLTERGRHALWVYGEQMKEIIRSTRRVR